MPGFFIADAGEGFPFPCTQSRKRRFAQSRRDGTAVQIPSRNLFGLSDYKAWLLKNSIAQN